MKMLLISYHYPPMGGAGVQRALKFSKYLRDFGIEPVVLSGSDPAYTQDPSLLADVPADLHVRRVPYTPLVQRLLSQRDAATASAASAPRPAAPESPWRRRLRDAALAVHAALSFPDDRAGWARRAYQPARKLLRDERIELIFSTAPPMSAHGLAARLAQASGLPWVADYRDLWTDNPGYTAPAWRGAFDRRTESQWLRRAAGVVTVTPSWRRQFEQRLGTTCPVAFIPNGYDEADFTALAPALRTDTAFRLVHTGSFYGPRDPATLLEGVALYLRNAVPGARPLVLRLVGNMGSRFAGLLAQFEAQHPGVIEHRPYVPHHEALAEMLAADALLLVVGAGQGTRHGAVVAGMLPGKIFEYLRAARPILLLGDEQGDAAQTVREHGAGWVADETRPERIAQALRQMMQPGTAPVARPEAQIARFERRALTAELAQFLRRCKGGPHV